jgi:NAD(P)-dependent dehydrogenase (short-subunit alcohol dehydrogenase family)
MSKVWLITGSSRGLGRALAEVVLAAGHELVATARNPEQSADLVKRYGDRVHAVAVDVTDQRAADRAIKTAVEVFGRLDVLVNNAGYGNVCSIEDMSPDDFRAQVETNFFGVVNVTRAAIPMLREQRSGHIIQISSIGARTGAAGLSAYQSAKFAVEGFSEVLSKEVGPLGVRVTIVEPGGFRTDWAGSSMKVDEIRPEYDDSVGYLARHVRAHDGKQQGDPFKAAHAILKIVEHDEPPLRLILGSDAVQIAERAAKATEEADLKWREISLSTDFQDELSASTVKWDR